MTRPPKMRGPSFFGAWPRKRFTSIRSSASVSIMVAGLDMARLREASRRALAPAHTRNKPPRARASAGHVGAPSHEAAVIVVPDVAALDAVLRRVGGRGQVGAVPAGRRRVARVVVARPVVGGVGRVGAGIGV